MVNTYVGMRTYLSFYDLLPQEVFTLLMLKAEIVEITFRGQAGPTAERSNSSCI